MATATSKPVTLPEELIPPLENGDHLTRDEFERRYEAMPRLKKAELIEGVVYLPSPARLRHHGSPQIHLATWLGCYEATTPGVEGADNATVRLDELNEPQPDAVLLLDPARGGQVRISDDDFIEGAPEMVAEVSASRVSIDLGIKLQVYQRFGAREYLVWRVRDREIDWFLLRGRRFQRLKPTPDGLLRSKVFPGLWLNPEAMVQGDLARVLAVVQEGVASPEHATFVTKLQSWRRGR
jgi:hypothetical protein